MIAVPVAFILLCVVFYPVLANSVGGIEALGHLALYFLGALIAIMWVLFPISVYLGLRRLEKIMEKIESNTRRK